ncbi:anti-sigma28 factor (negative regulator of flagellin synthesis) [Clostridium saccharobutylicum]|nr:anti-sigma28 factor (negative regulator of flagellin synthesis) [Clostridium saccharobutylicum]
MESETNTISETHSDINLESTSNAEIDSTTLEQSSDFEIDSDTNLEPTSDSEIESKEHTTPNYDIVLHVKPQKVPQIKSQIIDGQKCIVIPMDDDEQANVNGIDALL